jgi:RNA polymerase sigma-70 factor, ECF subfamily
MSISARVEERRVVEEQLVRRVREGDRDALARLIEFHRAGLIATAANILRDRSEAEDVAQEAFLKVNDQIDKLRDDRSFSRYLYQVAVRLCIDRLRRKRCEPSDSIETAAPATTDVETRLTVERLLDKMSPELRTIIILREVQELDYVEIAEVLNIPVGTVRSRLHVARERFRKLWTNEVDHSC